MNCLNSILIEGIITTVPKHLKEDKNGYVFTIKSDRFYKYEKSFEKEESFFDVVAFGEYAKGIEEKGKKGRNVRVVGRLKQTRWNDAQGKQHSKVTIVAEHIEYRPIFKRSAKKGDGKE